MNIFVCLKQVPGTDQPIKIRPDGSGLETDGIEFVINPYDEYAIEESLKIKEKQGAGTVTVVSLGPDRCTKAIRHALAMGCDEAIHLNDPLFEGLDPHQTALVIARALKDRSAHLVWTGKQAVDDDMAMVGQAIAEMMGLPHVTEVKKLELAADGSSATIHREVEGGAEVVRCRLPAVLTAQKGLNEPRYASLKGIMASKKKKVDTIGAAALGLDAGTLGPEARTIRVTRFALPEEKKPGLRKIEGTVDEIVGQTVAILKDELKVI